MSDAPGWQVSCQCGYTVEGNRVLIERLADDHQDSEHMCTVSAVSVPVADTTETPSISKRADGQWRHDGCDGYVIFDRHWWICGECGSRGEGGSADLAPFPAVPVPADRVDDRLAQIGVQLDAARYGNPVEPVSWSQYWIVRNLPSLDWLVSELAAAHRERDEATQSLAAQLAAERILHRRTTRERDAARADWDRQWEASRDFQADALDAQRERDAALAQLAKVRELAEKRLRPSSPIRERILAAAGGNPGSTP
jgi:hypothetical protein